MAHKLVKNVTKLFFGSAVAGAGFSFGRDIYKYAKKNFVLFILICVSILLLLIPYISAAKLFFFRPYSKIKWFFFVFLPWGIISFFSAFSTFFIAYLVGGEENLRTLYPPLLDTVIYFGCIWLLSFISGAVSSLWKRGAAKEALEIERHNEEFLLNCGVEEVDGAASFTHKDREGNKLRLEGVGKDIVEFVVVGSRGKRVYINLDEHGKFQEYTGVVSL